MEDILLFDPLNRFVWTLAITLLVTCAILLFISARKTRDKMKKEILNGTGYLMVGLFLSRLFFFISDYFANGYYLGHSYYSASGGDPLLFNLFGKLALMGFLCGATMFYFYLERATHKTKFIPLIINMILIICILQLSGADETLATYFAFGFNALVILGLVFYISKNAVKEFQIVSLLFLASIVIYLVGSVFDAGLFKDLELISPTLPGFFIILSTVITIISIQSIFRCILRFLV